MKEIIKLIRVKHWVKNFFIFTPAFFSGQLYFRSTMTDVLLGFFSFCFVASAIYVINDFADIEKDRLHPEKCKRPLASGKIKPPLAFIICAILFVSGVAIAFVTSRWYLYILLFYFVMNIAYSFRLKQIAILDVTLIAVGFLLRVVAGGILAQVEVSKWLFLMTFLLSMILALAKRRDEFIILQHRGSLRKSIRGYNLTFIDISMGFLATVTFVCYIMYTISEDVVKELGSDYIYGSSFLCSLAYYDTSSCRLSTN